MDDKILQTKKEMKRVINTKGLTRLERYYLAKEKCKSLSEIEKNILIKECYRDYESYDRCKDATELITIFLTGLGLIMTLYQALAEKSVDLITAITSLALLATIYVVCAILVVSWLQKFRSGNMNKTKYMLDILEEQV